MFDLCGTKVGIQICYDRKYPEGSRMLALKGAEILVMPICAATYGETKLRGNTWELPLQARAYENGVYVVAVNRAGVELGRNHIGRSMIVDPIGADIVAEASTDKAELLVAAVDLDTSPRPRRAAGGATAGPSSTGRSAPPSDAMHLAERLAEFAVQTQRRKPPAAAMAAARLRLLDGLAVALAALASEGAVKPRAALGLFGEGGASSAIGEAQPRSAAAAALHNGLLIHGLEYDDTHVGAVVHGAPVVLPAVLAIAERDGKSGAEALAALCAGWEVLARIGAVLRGALQPHGFQATSVAGPLAAAAAAASLSG